MKQLAVDESPLLKIGVLMNPQDKRIDRLFIENKFKQSSLNRIYSGRIINVVNSLDGAFVDIGLSQNAFIKRRDLLRALDRLTLLNADMPLNRMVKAGEMLVAQIAKEPYQSKGAQLTGDISIEGKYIVYLPNASGIKFSRKILRMNLKESIEQVIQENFGVPPGIIIRSSIESAQNPLDLILDELSQLIQKWDQILQRANLEKKIKCLYDAGSFEEKMHEWIELEDIEEIVTSSESFAESFGRNKKLKKIKESVLMTQGISLDQIIGDNRLKSVSGNSIVVDELEAFTIVDVNSSNQISTTDKWASAFATNLDLSKLILQRLELLNISGIILVDYINMTKKNQADLIKILTESVFTKELGYTLHGFTQLGILEITKKRARPSVLSLLSHTFEERDLLFWWLHQLYYKLMKMQYHTKSKAVEVEVTDLMYTFLVQNSIFDALDLTIKIKHQKSSHSSYKFITQ